MVPSPVAVPVTRAQRRPGPRPRRHDPVGGDPGVDCKRSTKAGAETPATRGIAIVGHPGSERSTKAGAETPATPALCAGPWRRPARSLNEGRGRDPGDTLHPSVGSTWLKPAQRRPGPRPRRHLHRRRDGQAHRGARSTKAGAETPATLPLPAPVLALCVGAQRRPGPRPRRHENHSYESSLSIPRSTKAGAETPATHGIH